MTRIVEIIKALESTTSRNEKIKIIQDNKDNRIFVEILYYTYNPFMHYYVKKLPKIESEGALDVEELWNIFKHCLNVLNNREITGNKAIDKVVGILRRCNKECRKVFSQVLKRKFIKAGINIKTINKALGKEFIPSFDIQLANEFDITKIDKYPFIFYVSPKLDGIRAIYLHDKKMLFTRNGNPILILPRITEQCECICDKFKLDFIDGELWSSGYDFNTIQSTVMSYENPKQELVDSMWFNIFACGNISRTDRMVETLRKINTDYPSNVINVVEQKKIRKYLPTIIKMTIGMLEQGYEGCMLRDGSVAYEWKKGDKLLKVKEGTLWDIWEYLEKRGKTKGYEQLKDFLDSRKGEIVLEDFVIVGVKEGKGLLKGTLGALIVEGIVKGTKITSKVGSGFKLNERDKLWKMKDELIGKEVVLTCQEITKDYSLRFPVVKAIKFDR